MGCIGLLAVLPKSHPTAHAGMWRGVLAGVSGAILLFLMQGMDPRSDVLGHTGGFIAGLLLACILRQLPWLNRSRWTGRAAFLLLTVLLLSSWWMALKNDDGQAQSGPARVILQEKP